MMNDNDTYELSLAVAYCSTTLCQLFHQEVPSYNLDKGLLENFGAVLGFLCAKQGLSIYEVGQCIACIVGCNGGKKDDFIHIANASEFYCKRTLDLENHHDDHFFIGSSICHSLIHPQSWNDFNDGVPLQELNGLMLIHLWPQVLSFFQNLVPQQINPILEKIS